MAIAKNKILMTYSYLLGLSAGTTPASSCLWWRAAAHPEPEAYSCDKVYFFLESKRTSLETSAAGCLHYSTAAIASMAVGEIIITKFSGSVLSLLCVQE